MKRSGVYIVLGLLMPAWLGLAAGGACDFAAVRELAAARAARPYGDVSPPLPAALARLTYDDIRRITFDERQAVWRAEGLPFRLLMFHLGSLNTRPVDINLVTDGRAAPLRFSPSLFLYHDAPVQAADLSSSLGWAGFRALYPLNAPGRYDEVISFLGVSYFRALGQGQSYGASARGLAVDCAAPNPEEFPRFVAFWLDRPDPTGRILTFRALLDGPRVTGAYEFTLTPGADTQVGVRAVLFARQTLVEYGLGALTSMFWFGENSDSRYGDFRPEVHDSDGLLVHRGDGTWVWRPLVNGRTVRQTFLNDGRLRGFGLLQRDRRFGSYEDTEARYHRRPSIWVEPVGDWGPGAVRLVELPTQSEYADNIVAYWRPAQPLVPGQPREVSWTLHWYGDNPAWPPLARCEGTRLALVKEAPPRGRFVLDFGGPGLGSDPAAPPLTEIVTDNGTVLDPHVVFNPDTGWWRLSFLIEHADKGRLAELRCTLRDAQQRATSETWTYQWTP